MAPIDAVNPFAYSMAQPLGGSTGGGFAPKIDPSHQLPKVGGVEKAPHSGSAYEDFQVSKWTDGLSGLRTGALGEKDAVYSKLPGGKETRLGARLNVDAFSVC